MSRTIGMMLVGLAILLACKADYEFEPPDREEQVAEAGIRFSESLFDSVSWASDSVRLIEGASVYAAKCRRCHGTMGEGETEYAMRRNIDVPSLVDPMWVWADSFGAVRRRVFVGHPDGMPTWGVAGISVREIDAAAHYLIGGLRPDVLGDRGR